MGQGKSVNVDTVGEWVDVPKNMIPAVDTYVDSEGVLRSSGDHSCVVWHIKGCERKGVQPSEIIYDDRGAPWCPQCARALAPEPLKHKI
jgi:hypothetical protein